MDYSYICVNQKLKTMKNLTLVFALLFSINMFSQKSEIKKRIIASGIMITSGAITSIVKANQKLPSNDKQSIFLYNQKQRDLTIASSLFYSLGGIAIISISYKF